jgi:hypothetical protein
MKCKACKNEIPTRRAELGYNECVNCSTIESYGCVDLVYHKTGNTLEIVDKQTAAKINKLARRSGFGVMRGIVGNKNRISDIPLAVPKYEELIIETQENFEKAGEVAISMLEEHGLDAAMQSLSSFYSNRQISIKQMNNLNAIVRKLSLDLKRAPKKLEHNPYTKSEPKFNNADVSDDITWAFRNWKK